MGYSTSYQGKFGFKNEITVTQLAYLKTILDENLKDLLVVNAANEFLKSLGSDPIRYTCLELSDDFMSVEWDGCEKFNDIDSSLNFITFIMRRQFEDFSFSGSCLAQGENLGDIWKCFIDEKGIARRAEISLENFSEKKPSKVFCPHCGGSFEYQ